MTRQSKVVIRLREQQVFNPHDFYAGQPYLSKHIGASRDVRGSHWAVVKEGMNLGSHWTDNNAKTFPYGSREDAKRALSEAMEWASEKFSVEEWDRDPFGCYGDKRYIERRLRELLGKPKRE